MRKIFRNYIFSDKFIFIAICFFTAWFLSACETVKQDHIQVGIRFSPASLEKSISVFQHLTVMQHGHTEEIDIALEVDPSRIDLVGLAMGQRVLSLHYDGKNIKSWRHFMLPEQVQAEDVLENIQLAFWPEKTIRNSLPPFWELKETAMQRIYFYRGEKFIEINYSNQDRWIGTIMLINFQYNYTLNIQSTVAAS